MSKINLSPSPCIYIHISIYPSYCKTGQITQIMKTKGFAESYLKFLGKRVWLAFTLPFSSYNLHVLCADCFKMRKSQCTAVSMASLGSSSQFFGYYNLLFAMSGLIALLQ